MPRDQGAELASITQHACDANKTLFFANLHKYLAFAYGLLRYLNGALDKELYYYDTVARIRNIGASGGVANLALGVQ